MSEIWGMTSGQMNRVMEITEPLAIEWLEKQEAVEGRIQFQGAYADLEGQEYRGHFKFAFSRGGHARYFGRLTFRLSPDWELVEPPAIEMRTRLP